jgi:hypothetical protein
MTTETQLRPSASADGFQGGIAEESRNSRIASIIKDFPNQVNKFNFITRSQLCMVNFNIVLVNLSTFVAFQDGPKADLNSSELTALLESSRKAQDKALGDIGLYRFLIPEDGNCLFRAIASQLNLEQESAHRELRQEAVRWMREHAEELLAYGLVDNLDEISESGKVGVWPGQAAIVAIANVRGLTIAIVQGGDKGPIDFQHIAPFDDLPAGREPKSVMLAYMYSGHYDGVAYEMKVNPEYAAWRRKLRQRANADEQLAQNIALEDAERDTLGYTRRSAYSTSGLSSSRYAGGSTVDYSSRYAGNDMQIRLLQGVQLATLWHRALAFPCIPLAIPQE